MKLTHKLLAMSVLVAGMIFSGATAATADPSPPPSPGASPGTSHGSVADIKRQLDKHLAKVTDRAETARTRVDASAKLTAAEKATLDADLDKLVADAATARREVDAATDRAGLEAAQPALHAVKADRDQLHKDWEAIPSAHKAPEPKAPVPSPGAS